MTDSSQLNSRFFGCTCLKWSAEGELTSGDMLLVLESLARVDRQLATLEKETANPLS